MASSLQVLAMKTHRSEFINLRGLRTHVMHWGAEDAPKIFMQHGWMDVAASFQFVVDCLQQDWHVITHDWRGFGLTERAQADCYWFADYLGDLDALLTHYSPDAPVNLLGHSMGGNVATLYAGVRPERVAKLVNLEGFGLPATQPEQAPERYATWLNELRVPPSMKSYASKQAVAQRLMKTNPRLLPERADYLAQHWAAPDADGQWHILGDPAHKITSAMLYRVDEAMACWAKIQAPVLWMEASDTDIWRWMGPKDTARCEIDRRLQVIPNCQQALIEDAGHMLHHDQPEALAKLIEPFFLS
jgi:pimeloyl-ACP methyl ester carboxylesterase